MNHFSFSLNEYLLPFWFRHRIWISHNSILLKLMVRFRIHSFYHNILGCQWSHSQEIDSHKWKLSEAIYVNDLILPKLHKMFMFFLTTSESKNLKSSFLNERDRMGWHVIELQGFWYIHVKSNVKIWIV